MKDYKVNGKVIEMTLESGKVVKCSTDWANKSMKALGLQGPRPGRRARRLRHRRPRGDRRHWLPPRALWRQLLGRGPRGRRGCPARGRRDRRRTRAHRPRPARARVRHPDTQSNFYLLRGSVYGLVDACAPARSASSCAPSAKACACPWARATKRPVLFGGRRLRARRGHRPVAGAARGRQIAGCASSGVRGRHPGRVSLREDQQGNDEEK